MLREYLVSEAMYALGIPTTRSLSVVATGRPVYRDGVEPGAVLARVASSHLRVGTFEFAVRQREVVQSLADYAIVRHYPELTSLPEQGPELVRVVRETRRVAQVGVQQRSMAHFIEAKQRFFDSGAIGRVHMVRTYWNANRGYLTPIPPGMEQKPAGLDWDACLGWLPKIPWDPARYFNRFAYWDFSTGGQTGGVFARETCGSIFLVRMYLQ